MTIRPASILPAMAAALLLAGCVSPGPFPSLAPRPEERAAPAAEPARETPVVPSDPALRTNIAALAALAIRGERDFDAAFGPAGAEAEAAGAQGSESWIAAQEALSRLESARAETTGALAELDRLALARADLPTNAGDHAALLAAIGQAERIAARQQARIDRLRAALSAR